VVRDGTPLNSTLTAPGLSISALHDLNSDNKSPPGVGGSGVFSFGALSKPCLAIKSNGNINNANDNFAEESFAVKRRRLQEHVFSYSNDSVIKCIFSGNIMASHHNSSGVGNQCLDSATNVPPDSPPVSTVVALASIANTAVSLVERHSTQSSFKYNGPLASSTKAASFKKSPSGVGGSGVFSAGGVSPSIASSHYINHDSDTASAALCTESFASKRRRLQYSSSAIHVANFLPPLPSSEEHDGVSCKKVATSHVSLGSSIYFPNAFVGCKHSSFNRTPLITDEAGNVERHRLQSHVVPDWGVSGNLASSTVSIFPDGSSTVDGDDRGGSCSSGTTSPSSWLNHLYHPPNL
jgi:hypothetical protein